jgi:hypothetical protein
MELNVSYIRQLMAERRLSIRGLAAKAGVSAAAICLVLNRKRGAGKVLIDGFIRAFPDEEMNALFFLPDVSSYDYEVKKRRDK